MSILLLLGSPRGGKVRMREVLRVNQPLPECCAECSSLRTGGFCILDTKGRWTGPGLDLPTWCPRRRCMECGQPRVLSRASVVTS